MPVGQLYGCSRVRAPGFCFAGDVAGRGFDLDLMYGPPRDPRLHTRAVAKWAQAALEARPARRAAVGRARFVRWGTVLPLDRQRRLLTHVRDGWSRVRAHPAELDAARRWLREHPGPWPAVDRLWEDALEERGVLAAWLSSGSRPEQWSHGIPLHSVLSSHPFASLTAWSIPVKSTPS